MSALEFEAWPKIARLRRPITITEKIDGTNAAIQIVRAEGDLNLALEQGPPPGAIATVVDDGLGTPDFEGAGIYYVAAQSRTRLLSLEKDNFGFARWVSEHAAHLVHLLGEGRHFGEWWGGGIQRGYGLIGGEKRFSLFNTDRYAGIDQRVGPVEVRPVPILGRHGTFDSGFINRTVAYLRYKGSAAEPGYDKPEGIVVFHHASGHVFKRLIEGDDVPKGPQG